MSAIRNRREQRGMATLSDKSHQEASEGRGDEYTWIQKYWIQIREEKLLRIKWDEKRKRSTEKQRYRAKMERPRINYIPKGLSVDYEEEYSKYLMQEVSFEPRDNDDFMAQLRLLERWHKKSIPQILEKKRLAEKIWASLYISLLTPALLQW